MAINLFSALPIFTAEKSFPPFYIYKISPGDLLVPFEFKDIEGTTWSNKSLLTRPMIFITGNWKLRHDLKKWAEFLSMKYNPVADVIWIFNPCGTEFADHYQRAESAFKTFRPPIPTVIDVHSFIGRSLKVDYEIPTIIGLSRTNRLAFTFASPFNSLGKDELVSLINTKLLNQ